jgi:cis-L-3-hydroxyproline dehydratase
MRIRAIGVFGYSVGYAHGEYVMSGGRGATRQTGTLVKVSTDDDLVGWGEVTPLGGTYLPAFTGGVQAGLRELAPALLGVDATNLNVVHRTMDAVLLGQQYAKSPVDMACWDIKGQALGVPLAALLGGVMQPDYPIYEPVPLGPADAMAGYIRERRTAGIERFQLKVGNDPYEDADRTRACLEAGGDATLVDVDANGGWSLLDARIAASLLEGLPCSSSSRAGPPRTAHWSPGTRHCRWCSTSPS